MKTRSHEANFSQRRRSLNSTPSLADAWIGPTPRVPFRSALFIRRWDCNGSLLAQGCRHSRNCNNLKPLNAHPQRSRASRLRLADAEHSAFQNGGLNDATDERSREDRWINCSDFSVAGSPANSAPGATSRAIVVRRGPIMATPGRHLNGDTDHACNMRFSSATGSSESA